MGVSRLTPTVRIDSRHGNDVREGFRYRRARGVRQVTVVVRGAPVRRFATAPSGQYARCAPPGRAARTRGRKRRDRRGAVAGRSRGGPGGDRVGAGAAPAGRTGASTFRRMPAPSARAGVGGGEVCVRRPGAVRLARRRPGHRDRPPAARRGRVPGAPAPRGSARRIAGGQGGRGAGGGGSGCRSPPPLPVRGDGPCRPCGGSARGGAPPDAPPRELAARLRPCP